MTLQIPRVRRPRRCQVLWNQAAISKEATTLNKMAILSRAVIPNMVLIQVQLEILSKPAIPTRATPQKKAMITAETPDKKQILSHTIIPIKLMIVKD